MEYRLTTPCTAEDLAPLKAGDTVLLSGVVYTARDQAHRRMIEALEKGEPLPFDLTGSAIYYAMQYLLWGQPDRAVAYAAQTLQIATGMGLGAVLVAVPIRLLRAHREQK